MACIFLSSDKFIPEICSSSILCRAACAPPALRVSLSPCSNELQCSLTLMRMPVFDACTCLICTYVRTDGETSADESPDAPQQRSSKRAKRDGASSAADANADGSRDDVISGSSQPTFTSALSSDPRLARVIAAVQALEAEELDSVSVADLLVQVNAATGSGSTSAQQPFTEEEVCTDK